MAEWPKVPDVPKLQPYQTRAVDMAKYQTEREELNEVITMAIMAYFAGKVIESHDVILALAYSVLKGKADALAKAFNMRALLPGDFS